MSFTYEDRLSDSPYVQMIWHTWTERSGYYTAAADGSWDMLISKRDRTGDVLVCGPATKAALVCYEAGVECIGIRFKLGTFLPLLPANRLLDAGTMLPEVAARSFWLGGSAWQFPDYENVDTFIDRLARANLLVLDPVVDAVLRGHDAHLSLRSVQRRFLWTTGLPLKYIRYIDRARQAVALLQQGVSIQDTIFQTGYADQPHLTKSLKRLVGQTPAEIIKLRRQQKMSS